MGGSFALALRKVLPGVVLTGHDNHEGHLRQALDLGLIDQKASELPTDSDLVIVAVPVNAAVALIAEVLDRILDETLVIDTGSTKAPLCQALESHPKRRNFMAVHPIAGTEFSGPSAAVDGLFAGKTNIVCEVEKTAFRLQEKGLQLFREMGMRIRLMDPSAHDQHIAYVSHLSHISSFMLGRTVLEKEKHERDIFDMAGSGFESTVRLAKSSPEMWAPIFEQNRRNVLDSLSEYIAHLEHFRSLLELENYDAVRQEMHSVNHIKEILNGIIKK